MKRKIYLIITVFLGIFLSFIMHAGIEIMVLQYAENVTWHSHFGKASCALPGGVFYGLIFVGIVGGYYLGKFWWQQVYIEKKHWTTKIRRNNNYGSDIK